MNRRKFFRLATLAALAACGGSKAAALAPPSSAPAPPPMPRCRITVLRRECFCDLQSRYLDDPETGRCQQFAEGDTFTVSNADRAPSGFCPLAWECIRLHVARVLDPATAADCGMSQPDSRAVIACCNDGTRPVIFKISPMA